MNFIPYIRKIAQNFALKQNFSIYFKENLFRDFIVMCEDVQKFVWK